MSRTLEEILNTPVKFEEGMRVFSLLRFKFGTIDQLDSGTNYPIDLLDDNGDETSDCYTTDGRYHENRPYRSLLTEQEAYELFPSLKPKVYEYQVVCKYGDKFSMSGAFYESHEEFDNRSAEGLVFVELYQPSKRERKS